MENKIKQIINKIKPALQAHGGDVEFVNFNGKTGLLKVELRGQCVGCPMAQITLKQGIEKEIKNKIPEVKAVEAV